MSIRVSLNPWLSGQAIPDQGAEAALPAAACRLTVDELRSWPMYHVTPLIDMPGLAAELGIARLWVKDEGQRQPLASFKALGAAYALGELVRDRVAESGAPRPPYADIWAGRHRRTADSVHACAATDGNHGRSLAWGASQLGARCTIYLPAAVSEAREKAIGAFGARTIRVSGNYEDTIARVSSDAEATGMVMLQDTSFPGYVDHCRRIMQGYTLLAEEMMDSLGDAGPPTHLFVQVGCGGLAAAVAIATWRRYGADRPRIIAIEPDTADSLRRSLATGIPEIVGGNHETVMIGMACGEVSMLAWDVLKGGAHSAVAIDDSHAIRAMRLSADGVGGDPQIEMGETGAAGLGALLAALGDAEARAMLGLDSASRVMLLNTEAAIDRETYERLLAA